MTRASSYGQLFRCPAEVIHEIETRLEERAICICRELRREPRGEKMAESDQRPDDPAGLRQRAEALWRQQSADRRDTAHPGPDISLEQALTLLHELEVH